MKQTLSSIGSVAENRRLQRHVLNTEQNFNQALNELERGIRETIAIVNDRDLKMKQLFSLQSALYYLSIAASSNQALTVRIGVLYSFVTSEIQREMNNHTEKINKLRSIIDNPKTDRKSRIIAHLELEETLKK